MSDQTPDPTAWSDDQLDDLLDRLAQRAAERDDLDLPGTGASRRGVLAGLLGLGGAAAGAGVASAIGENESYGSASGVAGTDNEPLQELNAKNGHFQSLQVDETAELAQLLANQSTVDDRITQSTNVSQENLSVTGLNPADDEVIRLIFTVTSRNATPGDLRLTVSGVTGQDYQSTFSDGSSAISSNGIVVYSTNDKLGHASGMIEIMKAGDSGRVGFRGEVSAGQFRRIDRTFDTGGLEVSAWPIFSVEFNASQGAGSYEFAEFAAYKYQF